MSRKITSAVFLLLMAIVFVGCGSSANSKFSAGTLYGKVVDATTRAGVSGATVSLYVAGDAKTATTDTDSASTTDYNEVGDFKIANVSDGTHRLRISVDGYAVYEEWIAFASPSLSTGAYVIRAGSGTGLVSLNKACSLTVYVTSVETGVVISGVTVYATVATAPELSGVTDATGVTTLSGLAQSTNYTLTAAPFDADADGDYDYVASAFDSNTVNCSNSSTTLNIDMAPARSNDALAVVGGSFANYLMSEAYMYGNVVTGNDDGAEMFGFSPSGSIVLVFNYPITSIDTDATYLHFMNDLVLAVPAGAAHDVEQEIALTAALSAGNTVLTLTPTSAVTNESYELSGVVAANINGDEVYYTFNDFEFTNNQSALTLGLNNWYAFSDTALTIDQVSVDNYNGTSDGIGAAAAPYLEFPQYVYGRATVINWVTGGVTNYCAANCELDVSSVGGLGVMAVDEDGPGAGNGCAGETDATCGDDGQVRWTVNLNGITGVLADNTAGAPVTVTLLIDATDYAGNHVVDEVTLPVE